MSASGKKSWRRYLGHARAWIAIDIIIVCVAYIVALLFRSATASHDYADSLPFIVVAAVITSVVLYLFGVYHRVWAQTSGHGSEVIIKATLSATAVNLCVDIVQGSTYPLPLSVILMGGLLSLFGLTAARYRSRLLTGTAWRWRAVWGGKFPQSPVPVRVLIVGVGTAGGNLAVGMKHRFPKDTHAYQVVGFVDDDPAMQGFYVENCQVLGTYRDIPRLCKQKEIGLIAIALQEASGAKFRELLAFCEQTDARIKLVPDMAVLMKAQGGDSLLRDVQPEDLIGRTAVVRHTGVNLNLVTDKVTLVTGAAGSIGSELCRQLCKFGVKQLILLDNNESSLHDLFIELRSTYPQVPIEAVLADIAIEYALVDVFPKYKPQIVFHAAAYKHVPILQQFPREAIRTNIGGTYNLIRFAIEFKVERFVMISTDKAVSPSSVMGASKRICELLLRAFPQRYSSSDTLFTAVRFGNVLGSRGSVLPTFTRQIDSGGPITITHPDMKRFFMSIPEAANLVIHAACLTRGNDTYLLRMGEEVRIVDLAERMIRLRGLRPYVDVKIEFTGVRPGEKLNEILHERTEILCETIHPNVIQLEQAGGWLDGVAFLKQVEALLRGDPDDPAAALMALVVQPPAPVIPRKVVEERAEVLLGQQSLAHAAQ